MHPSIWDFYLTPHQGLKGTSKPVHYIVLHNDGGFTATTLPEVCNQMSYLYARCTRAVSLVPVVYYAHLAAARGRVLLDGGAGESESDTASTASGSRAAGPALGRLIIHANAYANGMSYV